MFKNSIPIDSRFEITSEDIMGGKHLTIYPGKDTNKFILNGDTVSGKNSEVVSLTQDIGDFARTLNETFGVEQKNQIIEAVGNFNKFTKDLESFISANQDIITAEDKDNLHLILSNVNKVSGSLELLIAEQSDNISMAIENISDFTVDLPEVSSKISTLSAKIENMVDNINNGEGTLAKLIDDDQLYTEITNLVSNTNGLITEARSFTKDVQDNPKKYIRAYFAAKREDAKNK
jgi:phospholipid/cholesterol/gamma-HCH transport system substrate-binding protein